MKIFFPKLKAENKKEDDKKKENDESLSGEFTNKIKNLKIETENWENSIQLILTLLENIIQNPTNSKYKTLKKSNEKLKNLLFQYKNGGEIIKLCGFINDKDNENILVNIQTVSMIKILRTDLKFALRIVLQEKFDYPNKI